VTDQLLTNLITDSITIGVEATAVADQGSPVCLMALNPTAWKSLNIQGTADVFATACAVKVNSNHEEAMRQNGNGQATAESFCVHGNYSGTNYTPMPRRYCMSERDPLAAKFAEYLAALDVASMDCRPDSPKLESSTDNIQMAPSTDPGKGIYCGGVDIKRGTLTLLPGIHVFQGNLNVQAHGNLYGDGVTILLVGADSWFSNQAGATISVTAPSSGLFAGFVLAQAPDSYPPSNKQNTIIGGGYLKFDGIVYYPKQNLYITGNGDIGGDASQFAIIADTISIEGNGTLHIHISSDAVQSGLPALPTANEIVRLVK
jgi:hypothetical protein